MAKYMCVSVLCLYTQFKIVTFIKVVFGFLLSTDLAQMKS